MHCDFDQYSCGFPVIGICSGFDRAEEREARGVGVDGFVQDHHRDLPRYEPRLARGLHHQREQLLRHGSEDRGPALYGHAARVLAELAPHLGEQSPARDQREDRRVHERIDYVVLSLT